MKDDRPWEGPILRRCLAVGVSLVLHVGLLAVFASYVIVPELRELPGLLVTPIEPDEWHDDAELDGQGDGRSLSVQAEAAKTLLGAAPTEAAASYALPSAHMPLLDQPLLAPPDLHLSPDRVGKAFSAVSTLTPAAPRRAAFEGTVYYFDKAKRVRTGQAWFKGRGKEESPHKLYSYALWVPGRADTRVPTAVPLKKKYVGVDYQAQIYWPRAYGGVCSFRLTSDSAAVFQIDGKDVINHDGMHGFRPMESILTLEPGPMHIRLAYLEGPKTKLGLLLHFRHEGGSGWQLVDLRDILRENVAALENPLNDETLAY